MRTVMRSYTLLAIICLSTIIHSIYCFCGYDGTISDDLYEGLLYPNRSMPVIDYSLCLSICAVDMGCAALFYNKLTRICYTSTTPAVFSLPNYDTADYGVARVKNANAADKVVIEAEELAQGKHVDLHDMDEHYKNGYHWPATNAVDGNEESSLFSNDLSNPQGKGLYIDLGQIRKVVGVSIKFCDNHNYLLNHFDISLSDDTSMSPETGRPCNTVSDAVVNSLKYFPCVEGTPLWETLPSNILYQSGRYLRMIFNENAASGHKCIREIRVYGFFNPT